MRYIILVILLVLSLNAYAEPFEGWTTEEKSWFVASEIALLADYKTSSSVLIPEQGYREMNPFIGPTPSQQRLNLWFAGWMIGNYFIADNLDHDKRLQWMIVLTVVETAASANNISIGARIKF